MRASYGAAPVGDDAEIDDASDALLARGAGRRVTRGVALAFAAGCLVGCLARGGRGDLSPLFLATAPATRARADAATLGAFNLPAISCPASKVMFKTSLHDVYGSQVRVQLPEVKKCVRYVGCVRVGGNSVNVDMPNANIDVPINLPAIDGYSYCGVKGVVDALSSPTASIETVKTAACELIGSNSKVCDALDDVVDAVLALPDIARGLPDKLKGLLGMVWDPWLNLSADSLLSMIQGALDDVMGGSSAATLGSARGKDGADRAAFLAHLRENLRRAFAGEELIENSRVEEIHSDTAALGRVFGFCHEIPTQLWSDVESPSPPMPWPDKFASDNPYSPNNLNIRTPKFTIALCQTLDKFDIPPSVAVKVIQAFLGMFDAMFDAVYEASGVKGVVQQIENFGEQITGRKLLSDDQHALLTELKQDLSSKERVFYEELIVLHDIFNSGDGFKSKMTSQLGVASARARGEAALGGDTFEEVFNDFRTDLIAALNDMKDVRIQASTTLKYSFSLGIEVAQLSFREGELLSEFFERDDALTGTKVTAIAPGLFIAMDYEADFRLPYYFRAEVAGTYDFQVDVEFPITVSFGAGQGQNFVRFGEPRVSSTSSLDARGVAGLQVGAVASLDHAWVALCAGVVCAGPEIAAQQDVYTGFDAFFQIEQSGATCHAGPESLTAMWTNWDYASNTKNQCQRSALGAGAYVQIPKTVVGATVVLKPLPTENEPPLGMDPVITLFDFEPLIGEAYSSDGYFLEKELFHACSAPQSTTKPSCSPACQFTTPEPISVPSASQSLVQEFKLSFSGLNSDRKDPVGDIFSRTATFHLKNDWVDTGVIGIDLVHGSYVVEIYNVNTHSNGGGNWIEFYTGLMSWYAQNTNGNQASEIELHASGHASNGQRVRLRTLESWRSDQGLLRLQAKVDGGTTKDIAQYIFKFRRVMPNPQRTHPSGGIPPKNEMDDLSHFPVSVSTVPNEWVDTGIHGDHLSTGSYFVQIAHVSTHGNGGNLWHVSYVGLMSWYGSGTNSDDANEIQLHASGHAQNNKYIKLRTKRSWRTAGTNLRLQLLTNEDLDSRQTFHIWFRRVFPAQASSSMHIPANIIGTAVDRVKLLEVDLTLTTSWQNIWGFNHALDMADDSGGSFVVQILPTTTNDSCGGGLWSELATGIISWYDGQTNDNNANVVRLHQAGHASNGNFFELRTIRTGRTANMDMFFQIRLTKTSSTCATSLKFAFRRLV